MTHNEYIIIYAPYVITKLKGKKLFPSVMMAQAIIESSSRNGIAGGSVLASKYNNHFGIKADTSWKGKKVDLNTKEFVDGVIRSVKASFRVYEYAHLSFDDRIKFLVANKRYQKGGVFEALDPHQQTLALQRSGYATDPSYASRLMAVINRYGLERLDGISSDFYRAVNRIWSPGEMTPQVLSQV